MSPDVLLECPRTSFRDVLRVNVTERVWIFPPLSPGEMNCCHLRTFLFYGVDTFAGAIYSSLPKIELHFITKHCFLFWSPTQTLLFKIKVQRRYILFSVLFQTKSSLVWKSYTQKLRKIFQTNSSLVWEKN